MRSFLTTTGGKILCFSLCFLILAGIFYWVVADDWSYTSVLTENVSPGKPVGRAGMAVEQSFTVPADRLEVLRVMPEKATGDEGTVLVEILDDDGQAVYVSEEDTRPWISGQMAEIRLSPELEGYRNQRLTLRIGIRKSGLTFWTGDSMAAGKFAAAVQTDEILTVGDTQAEGQLVLSLQGISEISGKKWFWIGAALIWVAAATFILWTERSRKQGNLNLQLKLIFLMKQYKFLMKQLVSRDFKVKYKASVFGFLWSFLNPLLMMVVYLFVFSTIFRSNVPNFPVYLLSGIVLFNFFSDGTNLGLLSITGNAALITKVYIPKYIFPISKVFSSAVNLVISLVPLLLMMLFTGVKFTKAMLLLPFVVLFLVMLTTGVSLILSTMTVFFRDTQFLWGILITIINFMTPIFYPESIIPAAFRTLYHMNPLYQILFFMRSITLNGVSPTPITYLYCLLVSVIPLIIGLWVFRKEQDKFVLYL